MAASAPESIEFAWSWRWANIREVLPPHKSGSRDVMGVHLPLSKQRSLKNCTFELKVINWRDKTVNLFEFGKRQRMRILIKFSTHPRSMWYKIITLLCAWCAPRFEPTPIILGFYLLCKTRIGLLQCDYLRLVPNCEGRFQDFAAPRHGVSIVFLARPSPNE